MFLAGFDLSEDSLASGPNVLNGSLGINLTAGKLQSVELMGMQCGKECYAIGIAAALTFLAGIYQVKEQLHSDFTVPKLYSALLYNYIFESM